MSTMPVVNNRFQPIYDRSKGTTMKKEERNNLQDIIAKVRKLQELTRTTGFHTTRSIGLLLAHLTPDELVEVSEALHLSPREMTQR
jgi:hypothetical protein